MEINTNEIKLKIQFPCGTSPTSVAQKPHAVSGPMLDRAGSKHLHRCRTFCWVALLRPLILTSDRLKSPGEGESGLNCSFLGPCPSRSDVANLGRSSGICIFHQAVHASLMQVVQTLWPLKKSLRFETSRAMSLF